MCIASMLRCVVLATVLAGLIARPSEAPAEEIPPPGLVVAYMGDGPRNDANAETVYSLVLNYGADAVVHSGDTDYDERPDWFERRIDEHLGPQFPYFVSVGNHEDGSVWYDYAARFQARCDRIAEAVCEGNYGINSVVHYNGLDIVLSGVATMGSGHEAYVRTTLASSNALWKVCSWHKRLMGDDVAEACREYGAFIINGHEHNYRRSRTLLDVPNLTGSPQFDRHDLVVTKPGYTVMAWNGLGGSAITAADPCCSGVWSSAYDAAHGALFVTYNVDGNPSKAHAEFVDVDGNVIDTFTIMTAAVGPTTSTTTVTTIPSTTNTDPGVTSTSTTTTSTTTTTMPQPQDVLNVNGGFESGQAGWVGWGTSQNSGEVVRTTATQCEGEWSVQMFDSSTRTRSIHQDVTVNGGEVYVLNISVVTKNLGRDQAEVIVEWWNGSTMVGEDAFTIDPGTAACAAYGTVSVAPSAATSARIVLLLGPVTDGKPRNDAEVWYDAVEFGPAAAATTSTTTTTTTTSTVVSGTSSSSTTTGVPSSTTSVSSTTTTTSTTTSTAVTTSASTTTISTSTTTSTAVTTSTSTTTISTSTTTSTAVTTSTSTTTTSTVTTPSTTTTTVPGFGCPSAPNPACARGFAAGLLVLSERRRGWETMRAKWTRGPALHGSDYGNPLESGGTAYAICLYDDAGGLAGEYAVDRAGDRCSTTDCWKGSGWPPGHPMHKGYRYRDKGTIADGVLLMRLRAGPSRRSSALVRGRNNGAAGQSALPTGVVARLTGSASATLQLIGSDAPSCISVTLPRIVRDDGKLFQAKLP